MSNFPTSIPPASSASASATLAASGHTALHNNDRDEIRALATKVGIDGSADSTSIDKKLSGVSSGDLAASLSGAETLANKVLNSSTLNSPVIANFTNATHDHSANSKGGSLSGSTIANPTITGTVSGSPTIATPILTIPTISATGWTNANHTHAAANSGGTILPFQSASVQTASVLTVETTTSTSYVDLATTGPSVTVTIGSSGMALAIVSSHLGNDTAGKASKITFAMSGANTATAGSSDGQALYSVFASAYSFGASYVRLLTGLSAGSTTFKLQYAVDGGTGTFDNRYITVWAF